MDPDILAPLLIGLVVAITCAVAYAFAKYTAKSRNDLKKRSNQYLIGALILFALSGLGLLLILPSCLSGGFCPDTTLFFSMIAISPGLAITGIILRLQTRK